MECNANLRPVHSSERAAHFMKQEIFRSIEKQEIIYVRFGDLTAVTIKNVVFWDIKTLFVLHRRHLTSPLQSPAS
jgi:hypothetical protein